MAVEELKYFFSYTSKDQEFVLRLAKELRALGANLWTDHLDIRAGQHWDREVGKALKNCKGMIAVILKYGLPKTYGLDVSGMFGSVTREPNKPSYNHGQTASLTAVPDPNYRFDGWSGALSDSNNSGTLVIDVDKAVEAGNTVAKKDGNACLKVVMREIEERVGGSLF